MLPNKSFHIQRLLTVLEKVFNTITVSLSVLTLSSSLSSSARVAYNSTSAYTKERPQLLFSVLTGPYDTSCIKVTLLQYAFLYAFICER